MVRNVNWPPQVLCNIQVFAKAMPSLFAPHYENFFICSSDSYQVKALKLEILSSIATDSSILSIFNEFQVIFMHFLPFFTHHFIFLLSCGDCKISLPPKLLLQERKEDRTDKKPHPQHHQEIKKKGSPIFWHLSKWNLTTLWKKPPRSWK